MSQYWTKSVTPSEIYPARNQTAERSEGKQRHAEIDSKNKEFPGKKIVIMLVIRLRVQIYDSFLGMLICLSIFDQALRFFQIYYLNFAFFSHGFLRSLPWKIQHFLKIFLSMPILLFKNNVSILYIVNKILCNPFKTIFISKLSKEFHTHDNFNFFQFLIGLDMNYIRIIIMYFVLLISILQKHIPSFTFHFNAGMFSTKKKHS